MKWYLHWYEESEHEDGEKKSEHEDWATSWEEVVGYFNEWISKSSNVYKGEVICFWGDTPYGDGKPCLTFRLYAEGESEDEE